MGDNNFLHLATYTLPSTAYMCLADLGCEGSLLTHVQLLVHYHLQILSCYVVFCPLGPWPIGEQDVIHF